jgi:glycosyltransferase involved in cell wall biosynthesis
MIRDLRIPGKRVTAVHNGIDADTFRPDSSRRATARRSWNISKDVVVFGYVGRLHAEKGLDLAIEGLASVLSRDAQRDVRLVLVGDGPAMMQLRAAARTAGVSDRVVFCGFSDRPWELYPGIDFFLLPTRDESFGLSLAEAMACGCCPIAMGVGGVPEVLLDTSMGWLIAPYDRTRFCEAMIEACTLDLSERARMACAARNHVAKNFDAEQQFAALIKLIEQNTSAGCPPRVEVAPA